MLKQIKSESQDLYWLKHIYTWVVHRVIHWSWSALIFTFFVLQIPSIGWSYWTAYFRTSITPTQTRAKCYLFCCPYWQHILGIADVSTLKMLLFLFTNCHSSFFHLRWTYIDVHIVIYRLLDVWLISWATFFFKGGWIMLVGLESKRYENKPRQKCQIKRVRTEVHTAHL